ncbi:primase-helicase zinc-binding domain-containing protein [Roseovarius aestuariivivens]|uniref:primase-helicase zinc-binding domain-containing protein n=1 Tax=Roseovarius aestuariivivens TaxID=1888910 RepID=UPI001081422E|nr:primase-helicase zinc-binding domain-containing protein [Roseovarius aestuariivivens]
MGQIKTVDAARNKWRGILLELGLPGDVLKNRHGPCPLCGGKDRFRWDNKDGRGTYICNQCGSGDGMDLAIKVTGLGFKETAAKIDRFVGNIAVDLPPKAMSDDTQRGLLSKIYRQTKEVQPGDLVHKYLATRHLEELIYPPSIRFAPDMEDGEGGRHPAMVAMVGVPGETTTTGGPKYRSMHRTYLRPDGAGKAEIAQPRRFSPGPLPDGVCVQLCEYVPGGPLGIAEGIETALAASAYFEIPVWAALNSRLLEKWRPPAGCTEVAVFGDNDIKLGGQKSAYALGNKLALQGIDVTVQIPDVTGTDWADVWSQWCQKKIELK